MINKKGQGFEFSLISLVIIIIGLFLLGPIMLKVFNGILTPFSSAVGNQSLSAGASVSHIQNSFVNFWDFVLVIGFLVNVVVLFITAFFIDTHPYMVVLYIIFTMVLIIFAPDMMVAVDKIYSSPEFVADVVSIPMTEFLVNNFETILVALIVLSGVVIYGKLKYFSNSGGGGVYNY